MPTPKRCRTGSSRNCASARSWSDRPLGYWPMERSIMRNCRPSSGSLSLTERHGAPLRAGPDTAPDSKLPEYSQSKRAPATPAFCRRAKPSSGVFRPVVPHTDPAGSHAVSTPLALSPLYSIAAAAEAWRGRMVNASIHDPGPTWPAQSEPKKYTSPRPRMWRTISSGISGAGALPVRAANDTVRAGLSHRPRTRSMVQDRTVEPYRFSRGHAEPQAAAAAVAGPDRRPGAAAAEGRAGGGRP